jgi:hypothetical protein
MLWLKGRCIQNEPVPPVDPDLIIAGAKRYAEEMRKAEKIGTEFVARSLTWLNQQRWVHNPEPVMPALKKPVHGELISTKHLLAGHPFIGETWVTGESPEWNAWCTYRFARGQPTPSTAFNGGSSFASRWPPDHENHIPTVPKPT